MRLRSRGGSRRWSHAPNQRAPGLHHLKIVGRGVRLQPDYDELHRAVDPKGSPGQLAMIQASRAIEFGDDGGKWSADAPLVGAATRLLELAAPPAPPARDPAGDRLDDQKLVSAPSAIQQLRQERFARGLGQLVQRERGKRRGWGGRKTGRSKRRRDIR